MQTEDSRLQEQLSQIDGVVKVHTEEQDDGTEYHLKLARYTDKGRIKETVSDNTGLYNSGSYKLDDGRLVLMFYTPS